MPIELWLSAQREVDELIAIVAANSSYSIQEITDDYDELSERAPASEKDGVVRIRGSIISFVDRLDDEFTRSMQNIDPHGTEYVDRLKDEKVLYCTICRAQAFYEKTQQDDPLSRVVMRRLEHIYSKVRMRHRSSKFSKLILNIHSLMLLCRLSKPQLSYRKSSQISHLQRKKPRPALFMDFVSIYIKQATLFCGPGPCFATSITMLYITIFTLLAICCLCHTFKNRFTPLTSRHRSFTTVPSYNSVFVLSDVA
jgi:hypothetical protein